MKYLIVGLGNPGPDYADTRHNIGFSVLDSLVTGQKTQFSPARYADHAEFRHKGKTFICIKPQTFMNLSGKAVRYWMDQEFIISERVPRGTCPVMRPPCTGAPENQKSTGPVSTFTSV